MHVAELNIGRLNYPIDDPRMADFVDNLGRVNAMAERMPGFVWRLVGDGSNDGALDLRPYRRPDDGREHERLGDGSRSSNSSCGTPSTSASTTARPSGSSR